MTTSSNTNYTVIIGRNNIKILAIAENKTIGHMNIACSRLMNSCNINMIEVEQQYQGQGHASSIYKVALDYLDKSKYQNGYISGKATTQGNILLEKYLGKTDEFGYVKTTIKEARNNFNHTPDYQAEQKALGGFTEKVLNSEENIGCPFL